MNKTYNENESQHEHRKSSCVYQVCTNKYCELVHSYTRYGQACGQRGLIKQTDDDPLNDMYVTCGINL